MFCRHTASAPITTFSPKRTWGKNKIVIDFDPFLWPWTNPPPQELPGGGVLQTACACDLRKVTFQVELTSWLDKLSLVKWFEERPEARMTSQLDKRNWSSSTCAQNTSVGPWHMWKWKYILYIHFLFWDLWWLAGEGQTFQSLSYKSKMYLYMYVYIYTYIYIYTHMCI